MFKKYTVVLLIFLVIRGNSIFSQDPQFTQFYANPIYLNPAFAGTLVCPRLIINYRNQWPMFPGHYSTYSVSYDYHKDKISGGLGFLAHSDVAGGIYSTHNLAAMYSYSLGTGPNLTIKGAVQVGIFYKTLNWNKFSFGDQIDRDYGFIYESLETTPSPLSRLNFDIAFGGLVYNRSYYVGLAVHHLTKSDEAIITWMNGKLRSNIPRKLTFHAGAVFDINSEVKRGNRMRRRYEDPTISLNLLFMLQQQFQQMCYGFYLNIYPIVGGLWFRHSLHNSDAVAALVGIQTNNFKLGYSYDFTISKLTNSSGGAHEVSCAVRLQCRPEKKRIITLTCPSF